MKNILTLNKISPVINDVFTSDYVLGDDIVNPDGILVRSFNMTEYETGDKLLAIGRAGAGVNNIPIEEMAKKGIVVFNTPGANANAVKELVICGMLLASRDIIGGSNWVNTLTENVAKTTEKGKKNFAGHEIFGKTLGIVGLGAIGRLVADASIALGMKVIGYDPYLNENVKKQLNPAIQTVSLEEIIKQSDIITLHVPLVDSTKNMINAETLAEMKDGVIILNMARGALVNTTDIKEAIENGKVAKYVVDFPDETILNTKGIIAIPHLGASTEEAEDNCAVMAGKELIEYIENGNIINSVNYPCISKERTGKIRTCVLFKAEDKELIEKLEGDKVVAVRGNYGYAIIDADKEIAVNAIKVRVL